MNVSRDEAAKALEEIGQAGGRMARVRNYAEAAPFFFLWGLVWLGANTFEDLSPAREGLGWMVGGPIGLIGTALLIFRRVKSRNARIRAEGRDPKANAPNFALLAVTGYSIVGAIFVLFGPLDVRQVNALISICFAFGYMMVGAWLGWRLFVVGAVAAAAILIGYAVVGQHYFLWMGVVGGGALIASGLWLKKL